MGTSTAKQRKSTWKDTLRSLKQPKVAVMAALGLAAGLPFMMIGNTLGFWLRESGIELATIGYLSWVGLFYSYKFLWAPLVDKMDAPVLGRLLGRRRGWMMLSQIIVGGSLLGMAIVKPEGGIMLFTGLAALAGLASATQDIVVDAWRIEVSDDSEEMALLSSSYQLGYRAAMSLTDAWILVIAAGVGWSLSYATIAALMVIGVIATYFAKEPKRVETLSVAPARKTNLRFWKVVDAIAGPFVVFFRTYGVQAALMLTAISFYRLPDFIMGPMANPFYVDLGIAKEVVGSVRGTIGLVASIGGITAAGLCAVTLGFRTTFIVGAILGPASNLGFSFLAMYGASIGSFSVVMAIDNFASGFAGTALVGYMSSLTAIGYSATQYALLSSFYTILGKFLKGFSGAWVQKLTPPDPNLKMMGFAYFFFATALIGIPAVILCFFLANNTKKTAKS